MNSTSAKMAGTKRKQDALSGIDIGDIKKRKQGLEPRPATLISSNLEAETDSDPIVESDTTEHSGDDNGVSWPSDYDEDLLENDEEEAALPDKKPTTRSKPTAPPETTNGSSSKFPIAVYHPVY